MTDASSPVMLVRAPFRSSIFRSREDWEDLAGALGRSHSRHRAIETVLKAGPLPLLLDGICQACGQPTRFRAEGGEDAVTETHFWQGLKCLTCGLDARQRALFHFLISETGLRPGRDAIFVEGDAGLEQALAAAGQGRRTPAATPTLADMVIARSKDAETLTRWIKRLRPGGRLLLALIDAEAGWALRSELLDLGLVEWRAHLYWNGNSAISGPNSYW
jgi:hypothetical protein